MGEIFLGEIFSLISAMVAAIASKFSIGAANIGASEYTMVDRISSGFTRAITPTENNYSSSQNH